MEIKKETMITALTTDNKPMEVGKTYIFNANGKCWCGKYLGVSKHSALMFEGLIVGQEVKFNIMPKTVGCIYALRAEI